MSNIAEILGRRFLPNVEAGANMCEQLDATLAIIGADNSGIKFSNLAKGENSECIVDTFFPEHLIKLDKEARETFFHYDLIATPIIYSGQKIKAQIFSEVDKNINIIPV